MASVATLALAGLGWFCWYSHLPVLGCYRVTFQISMYKTGRMYPSIFGHKRMLEGRWWCSQVKNIMHVKLAACSLTHAPWKSHCSQVSLTKVPSKQILQEQTTGKLLSPPWTFAQADTSVEAKAGARKHWLVREISGWELSDRGKTVGESEPCGRGWRWLGHNRLLRNRSLACTHRQN